MFLSSLSQVLSLSSLFYFPALFILLHQDFRALSLKFKSTTLYEASFDELNKLCYSAHTRSPLSLSFILSRFCCLSFALSLSLSHNPLHFSPFASVSFPCLSLFFSLFLIHLFILSHMEDPDRGEFRLTYETAGVLLGAVQGPRCLGG